MRDDGDDDDDDIKRDGKKRKKSFGWKEEEGERGERGFEYE